ncbi:MAG TPA: hypothetical protein VLB80_00815 [Candidatus Babeliales bacterium]|nr:hypothetical protein [Candidatus Babeliales bacterium]
MKYHMYYVLLVMVSSISFLIFCTEKFNVILKPKWYDLDQNCTKVDEFGGKWILAGSITFKKRCKNSICIETICLQWNGECLDNLIASLYKKNLDKDVFLPIEENLICDGTWNKDKQTLVLNFNEKENLAPTTVFYLVLTVPQSIETLLKKGSFFLEEQSLPKPFKECAHHEKLSFMMNDATAKKYHKN